MARARSIIARDDTLLGVCFALGEDFGVNPVYFRILFGFVLFWSPIAAAAAYAGLGALVAFSRWVAPNPESAGPAEAEAEDCGDEPFEELPLAA